MTQPTRRLAARRAAVHRASVWWSGDERGSAAIETVVVVPAFVLFVLLIVYAGRLAVTEQAVEAAAGEAARAASIARTAGQAQRDATTGAAASLRNQGLTCVSQHVAVDTSGFATPVGSPARVSATVTCQVDLSDLALPGLPGARAVTATLTSPIDTYRGR